MNLAIKRIVFGILIVVNCFTIFMFSSQDSVESSNTSGVVVDRVVNTISKVNKKVKKENIRDSVTFWVRKCAHFSIYAMLGVWLMLFLNTFEISTKNKVIICIIFGLSYAISDEVHQGFVGGRSTEIRDVLIDTAGCFIGCMIAKWFGNRKSKNKKEKKDA